MCKQSLFIGLMAMLLLISIVSCKKEAGICDFEVESETLDLRSGGLSQGTMRLSEDDAVKVASMFMGASKKVTTKSIPCRSVKNVVPINGGDGTPAIYAINYDDGFLWVAATKKLYPILAVVGHGVFDTSANLGIGIDVIKEQFIAASDSLTFDSVPIGIQNAWREYEERSHNVTAVSLSTKSLSDDYQSALDEVYSYALHNGYDVYKLSDMVGPQGVTSDVVPEDLLNDFYQLVMDDDTFGIEYTANTAYVLKKAYIDETIYGPYAKTKWDQIWPYNSALDDEEQALGCVTIATAQVMRFYEKPSVYSVDGKNYYWSNMPNYIYSPNMDLSTVLADLRVRLKIDDSGNGYMKDAVTLLNSYGYDVAFERYNSSSNTYLRKGNVVIFCGQDIKEGVGHAWVCDGIHDYKHYVDYKLFALDREVYPEYSYDCISDRCDEEKNEYRFYYHMNWGWGGRADGWFYSGEWTPNANDFTSGRGMIVVKIKK